LVCLVREKYPDKDGKYTNWKPASKKKKWFLVVLLYGTSFTCFFFSGINNVWIRYGLGAQSQLDRLGTDGIFVIFSISCPGCHSTTLMCLPPWTQGKGGGMVATLACGLGGTQFGRLDRKPGTLYTL
jgi:hypothetical protein